MNSADPRQVLRILDYRGINVRVDGERLIARARVGQIPDDMVRFIRHFKPLIIVELQRRHRSAA